MEVFLFKDDLRQHRLGNVGPVFASWTRKFLPRFTIAASSSSVTKVKVQVL
jgi:hypothetical protein